MKKWLVTCLLAIALLFAATTAMAGHNKANGEYCLGGSYALLKEYENQHLLRCNDCQEEILENHWIGQEATCIRKAQCGGCPARFGDYGPHDWGAWQSRGNNSEHVRTCQRDGCDAVDTASCSGDSSASCVTQGTCTSCGGAYYGTHYFGRPWTYGQDETSHWRACKYCDEGKEAVDAHFYVESREDQYLASKATCVSPAIYYKSCTICRRTGTETFKDPWGETDQKNHDLMHFAAKAPTCTKSGWNEYDE